MTYKIKSILFVLSVASVLLGQDDLMSAATGVDREAQQTQWLETAEAHVFKTVSDVQLKLYVFQPEGHQASDRRPAIVLFFGGNLRTQITIHMVSIKPQTWRQYIPCPTTASVPSGVLTAWPQKTQKQGRTASREGESGLRAQS